MYHERCFTGDAGAEDAPAILHAGAFMSRVLEVVLCLSQDGWPVKASNRTRAAPRDFGAELVRAWRICPQVRMRRGHERVT
ncbi:hypothetical protein B1M_17170, partial [Burkholderia sp. TJI49]